MSKFDFSGFCGGYDDFAANKEKYTKEKAIELFKREMGCRKGDSGIIAVCEAYVIHRAGVNEDHKPVVGWWLEYKPRKRSCPVWAFHFKKTTEIFKNYEYVSFAI